MSGKGLAFLNKKGFHPSTLKNQERVWKVEQQAAAEEKRIAEIKKQYEEERKLQELYQIKEAALPQTKKQERLDWMYQGSAAWRNEQQEQQLLGQKPAELPKEEAKSDSKGLGLFAQKAQNPVQDAWAKLRDDPLLEIKKREQAAKQQIKQNPVKMEKILKALKEDISKDKKEKKSKKDKRSRSRSRSPGHRVSPTRARSPPRTENGHGHRDSHNDRRNGRRSASPPHDRDRDRERSERDRERERGREHRDRDRSPRGRSPRRRSPSPARHRDRSPRGRSPRQRSPRQRSPHYRDRSRSRSPVRPDQPKPNAAAATPAAPPAATGRAMPPPYQRPNPKRPSGPSTSAMTEEERQRRLAQMQQNAKLHEEKTNRRLAAAAEEDRREKEEEANRIELKNAELRPEFLEKVNKKVYAGDTSVEERLQRGAHFRQRPIDLESKGVAHV